MNENSYAKGKKRFSLVFWIAVGVLGLVAVVLFMPTEICGPRAPGKVSMMNNDTDQLKMAIKEYKSEYGAYPAGDTRDVIKALTGENPRKIKFFSFQKRKTSEDFLDPWGAPYKIYFSGDDILIRSAGPNKHFDEGRDQKGDDYFR